MDKHSLDKLRQKALKLLDREAPAETKSSSEVESLLAEHSVLQAELDSQNQELQDSNLRMRHQLLEIESLFDSTPVAYCVIGPDRRIIRCNKTFQQMISFVDDVTNNTFTSVYVAQSNNNDIYNWLKNDDIINLDVVFNNEPETWHRLKKNEYHSGQLLVSIEDITDQKQTDNEKANRAEEVQKQLDIKAQILATMSHEIKTPLTSVMGFLDLLLEDELPDTSLDKVRRARNSSEGLLAILNDYLELARLNSGQFELYPRDINLKDAVNECLEQNQAKLATDKQLQLSAEFHKGVPEFIHCDVIKLKQILNNLVGNAIKFTDEGEIHLKVNSLLIEQQQFIEFSVFDSGVGLDGVNIPKLFDEYQQHIPAHSSSYISDGTGLGLAICKKLVNAMGGSISAENRRDAGSRFWFRIPYVAALDVAKKQPETTPDDILDMRPLNILIAENDVANQLIIKTMLEKLGQSVTLVSDGQKAIASYNHHKFDLIILDTHMPVKTGEVACQEIRELEIDSEYHTPIFSWSADTRLDSRTYAMENGMDGLLSKPIKKIELIELINLIHSGEFSRSC